jgi:cell pole-organizing protein PopZ
MSAANPKPQEPSMEEILASIRRIISDDEGRAAAERAHGVDAESDDPSALVATFPRPAPLLPSGFDRQPSASDDGFHDDRFGAHGAEDLPDYPRQSADVAAAALEKPEADEAEPLISRATDASVGQAFDLLAHTVLAGTPRPIEEVVREMLRPMLRVWLDDNLPTIVERLVRAEIERVARGGR